MALEIKQSLRLSQQLVMTPQLQQAIKLLQLNRLELAESINQELLENPLLEIAEETTQDVEQAELDAGAEPESEVALRSDGQESEAAGDDAAEVEAAPEPPSDREVEVDGQINDEFDWENYLGEYSSGGSGYESIVREDKDAPAYENMLSSPPSLRDHLLEQLSMTGLGPDELRVGEAIIESLDADGYLPLGVEELAQVSSTDTETAERTLKVIQGFDPSGVAARDLRECLLVQAMELYPDDEVLQRIISDHLPDLERRRYQVIVKKLKIDMDRVAQALDAIRCLDPRPGQGMNNEQAQYITPDIYVYKVDGEFVIMLNEDGLPKLRVNNFYRESLALGGDAEAKEYVRGKLRSALWLIRSIHQRQRTIYKVTESIIKFQREFFEKGITRLKPLVLRDVAEDVGMHESTISRVTTNKYMHTPQGVFELKYFFNSGINRFQGQAMASEAVKERIRRIIADEDTSKPLSDQVIAEMLEREDIDIARRTVAKYREMLGILPSSRRRQPLKGFGKPKG
ncbi:MAG: RNA polymerase factor sigma-54 [Desulfarculaceae bacterium]|nr:RNA polymerase factor sigma-54 [Desulfarculaceae bacterium]MCF8047243.1 RNA polymerase factor sigma-54 [Desulfarculaceae bacterium]MCF8065076.1 RNA polymerase factor sigma-54 [Desulfarculaceae bacterium]MCF8098494.1 RNA polymerase factor sigma-54 [Desulfarculaceae bacterium]MCF8122331.1 RNA polymerase factor sigma-54 [Desulfarculaceae bacterium]